MSSFLSQGVPGVALAVRSPHRSWAEAARPPAHQAPRRQSTRQTLDGGASDSLPDLSGSPCLWLMDDPLLSLPPPSGRCCLQGHRPPRVGACAGREKPGRLARSLLAWPPSFHSCPACNPKVLPSSLGWFWLARLPMCLILSFSHCELSACQLWARHCAGSLPPMSSPTMNSKQDLHSAGLFGLSGLSRRWP